MHPNLAQILRSWLSCQILNQEIDTQAINALLDASQPPVLQRTAISKPADLIQWTTPRHRLPPMVSTTHKPSARSFVMESKKLKNIPNTTKSLNPLASPFQPNFQPAILPHRESVVHRVASIPSATKLNNKIKAKLNNHTSTIGPAKRTNTVLPGQRLVTAFFRKNNMSRILPKVPPLSLSLPKSTSTQNSKDSSIENPMPLNTATHTVSNQTTGQRTLFDFAYFKPQSTITDNYPEVWGHMPEEIDTTKTLRKLLQNPNGIRPSVTEPEFLFSLHVCHSIGVGAICITETNLKWHHSQHKASMRRCLHRNWKSSRFQTSVPEEHFLGNYQPGGTATIITDQWTSCIIDSGMDPFGLGRWSYVTLRGKSELQFVLSQPTEYATTDTPAQKPPISSKCVTWLPYLGHSRQ
jgi:hypothetical protein